MGAFFYAGQPLGPSPGHDLRRVLRRQFLKAVVARDGLLELGDLLAGHIAGNIAAIFIALVIVVGAVGTLADHADAPAVHVLNLREVVEDGFGSGFGFHWGNVYAINIYLATKSTGIPH